MKKRFGKGSMFMLTAGVLWMGGFFQMASGHLNLGAFLAVLGLGSAMYVLYVGMRNV